MHSYFNYKREIILSLIFLLIISSLSFAVTSNLSYGIYQKGTTLILENDYLRMAIGETALSNLLLIKNRTRIIFIKNILNLYFNFKKQKRIRLLVNKI